MQDLGNMIFENNGYIPFMFAALLWWVLKTNDEREKRYINIIDNRLDDVENIVQTRLNNVEQKVDEQDKKIDKILEKVD